MDGINQDTVLTVFTTVSKTLEGAHKADKSLDKQKIQSARFDKKMDDIIKSQKKLDTTLDKVNENTKKLNSYFKK